MLFRFLGFSCRFCGLKFGYWLKVGFCCIIVRLFCGKGGGFIWLVRVFMVSEFISFYCIGMLFLFRLEGVL